MFKKKILSLIIMMMVVPAVLFAQVPSEEEAYNMLDKVFSRSNFDEDFSCTLSLISEKPGEPKAVHQYQLFRKDKEDKTCLVKLAPEVDKGQGYLQVKDNLWFYNPVAHQFTHSSIMQRLSNTDAKISDVKKKAEFKRNYKITKIEEGKLGKFPVFIVSVDVLSKEATYPKEKYFIRKDVNLILKMGHYGAGGRLMRTTLIPKYVKLGSANLPVQQIYINNINKGEKTTQIFQNFSTKKIPDMVFTKAYLEKIN